VSVMLHLAQGSLPLGAWNEDGGEGSLVAAWRQPASTMLYSVPHIRNSKHFIRNYEKLQPKLEASVHGLSHPPLAALSFYWIQQAAGAREGDFRDRSNLTRCIVGLALAGSLNLFIVYQIGLAMFGRRTGLLAAALWAASPAVSAFSIFAQDYIYALFFNLSLLLTWKLVFADDNRRVWLWGGALGCVFAVCVFMNYSWCLATSVFALTVFGAGKSRGFGFRATVFRSAWPLTVMTLLGAAFILHYKLDYFTTYKFANDYVSSFYHHKTPLSWLVMLVGGQIEWLLMMGSVTASAFVAALCRWRWRGGGTERLQYMFLLFILAVYACPLLFGPPCLKAETARCWNWIATVPVVFAARQLLNTGSALFTLGAPAVSIATYTVMRLALKFTG